LLEHIICHTGAAEVGHHHVGHLGDVQSASGTRQRMQFFGGASAAVFKVNPCHAGQGDLAHVHGKTTVSICAHWIRLAADALQADRAFVNRQASGSHAGDDGRREGAAGNRAATATAGYQGGRSRDSKTKRDVLAKVFHGVFLLGQVSSCLANAI